MRLHDIRRKRNIEGTTCMKGDRSTGSPTAVMATKPKLLFQVIPLREAPNPCSDEVIPDFLAVSEACKQYSADTHPY